CGNNNNNDQSKNTDTASANTTPVKAIDTPSATAPVVSYSHKADLKDPKPGDRVTLLLNFDRYEEGDYAHTIFEEPNSADVEWDFGHPSENKFGDIPIVLTDEKSGWGYKTNPAYVNKRFIVTAQYTNLDGNDVDGKPIKYQDWRVISMKPE
ncbi:MAG TPA: hypothetical protein VHM26_01685, partial [Chitinophagaceae bacterium]|nr:hypothetical protein [Chitinophagaceae bacterium]